MIRFLTDEDFDNRILRGLLLILPKLDILRIQDVGLRTAHDTKILAFAASENRVLLTQDIKTMFHFAADRIDNGLLMAGVIAIPRNLSIREIIEELALIAEYSAENEWQNRITRLPL